MKVEAKTQVLYYSALTDTIQRAQIEVLTPEEKDRISKEIAAIKQKNKKLRNDHIKQVRKLKIYFYEITWVSQILTLKRPSIKSSFVLLGSAGHKPALMNFAL